LIVFVLDLISFRDLFCVSSNIITGGLCLVLNNYREIDDSVLISILRMMGLWVSSDQLRTQMLAPPAEDSKLNLGGISCLLSVMRLFKLDFISTLFTSLLDFLIISFVYPSVSQELCGDSQKKDTKLVKIICQLIKTTKAVHNISRCLSLLVSATEVVTVDNSCKLVLNEKNVVEIIQHILQYSDNWIDIGYPYTHFFVIIINNILLGSKKEKEILDRGGLRLVVRIINSVLRNGCFMVIETANLSNIKSHHVLPPNEQLLSIFKGQITKGLNILTEGDCLYAMLKVCVNIVGALIVTMPEEDLRRTCNPKNEVFHCLLEVLTKMAQAKNAEAQKVAEICYNTLKKVVGKEEIVELVEAMNNVKKAFPECQIFKM
jgi:hypothetical protein